MDAYTAQDTLILEDYEGEWILSDLADGTVVQLSAPNEKSTTTTGYNGNSLGAHNESGRQRECTIRIVKGSGDDKRLNRFYNMWEKRDLRWVPLKASFTKKIGHSDGSMTDETIECKFGLPATPVEAMQDTTGSTDQLVAVYMIRFGNSERSM